MNADSAPRWSPTLRPSQPTWTRKSARKKWQLPSASTVAIYYYLVRELILILPSTESGRLSRPRHCNKGEQPVPKAVYRSGCRDDKHNCPRWDSNRGLLTPQSGMLPLDHCDIRSLERMQGLRHFKWRRSQDYIIFWVNQFNLYFVSYFLL